MKLEFFTLDLNSHKPQKFQKTQFISQNTRRDKITHAMKKDQLATRIMQDSLFQRILSQKIDISNKIKNSCLTCIIN